MMSPLFDSREFFVGDEGWEMTSFGREALSLTADLPDLWRDLELDTLSLNLDSLITPSESNSEVSEPAGDWATQPEDDCKEHKEMVHHDCMWAGSCADSVHPSNTFVPAEPVPACSGRGRSLLKQQPDSPPRPETPPSLDEEDAEHTEFKHTVDVAGTAQRLLSSVVADHSYTLVKPEPKQLHYDNLGVQTPSDSEEEIDVVSVGEKTIQQPLSSGRAESFPRVPSALDRHNIQNTVASAMSPRPVGRKRLSPPSSSSSSTPRKRMRSGRRSRRSPTDSDSDAESPEFERRSLHNDMERMRRIGLKNLFDELKNHVPSIKEKDRAPKVVVLREAAVYCRRLQEEDIQRDSLKRQQNKLMTKLKKLRSQLAARYNHH